MTAGTSGARGPVIRYRPRTARKGHRCCECGTAILSGSRYTEHVDSRGGWRRRRLCSRCARSILRLIDAGQEVLFGRLLPSPSTERRSP